MMPTFPRRRRGGDRRRPRRRDEISPPLRRICQGVSHLHGVHARGRELVPTRGVPPKGSKRARASDSETSAEGSDVACLGPSRSLDLGTIAFAPRQARRYEAHLCVRNNFTTLECATLRGDGDEVRVHVAKKPGGSTVVSDVAFRLPRAGAGADSASDVLTQTIHVSNRGSSTVSVAKPYVGALECGGDGSHAGYYVQPCGACARRGRQRLTRGLPERGDGGGARRVDDLAEGHAGREDLVPHCAQSVGTFATGRPRGSRRDDAVVERASPAVVVAVRARGRARTNRSTDPIQKPTDTEEAVERRGERRRRRRTRRRLRRPRRRGGARGGWMNAAKVNAAAAETNGEGERFGFVDSPDSHLRRRRALFSGKTTRGGVFDPSPGEGQPGFDAGEGFPPREPSSPVADSAATPPSPPSRR